VNRNNKGQFKRGHSFIIIPEKVCEICKIKYQPTTNGQKRCGSWYGKTGCSYKYFLEYSKKKRKLQTEREKLNPNYSAIMRDRRLINKYNISQLDYELLVKKQDGKCVICRKDNTLVVDHNHKTGNIRELLCDKCNLGLGNFKDNIELLSNAIMYLKKHGK